MACVGQTIRATVSSLKDANGVTLISPAVTINLTSPSGAVTNGSVAQVGSSYWAEFIPDVSGNYIIRSSATSGGSVWKGIQVVFVDA